MIKLLFGLLAVFAAQLCLADPDLATMAIVRAADIKWTEAAATPGLSTAVVYGDPSKPGLYIIRVRFAPGIMSSPHFHSEERYVAVLKGTWWVGAGPKWDKNATTPIPVGSFVVHHAHKIHFDGAKDEEVILQITGMGPSTTTLVDESGAPKKGAPL